MKCIPYLIAFNLNEREIVHIILAVRKNYDKYLDGQDSLGIFFFGNFLKNESYLD